MSTVELNLPLKLNSQTWLDWLAAQHAPALFRLTDMNRNYLRTWLPWLDTCQTLADSTVFIEQTNMGWQQKQSLNLGIWEQGKLIGVIGFHAFDWAHQSSSIGYWLDENQQGKGIMTQACSALLDIGFQEIGLKTITISCATENLKSQRIPQNLGMVFESVKKDTEWLYDHYVDHVVYKISATEWLKAS